jgi:predicted  nucleic acid-binding Zn-ribbon protein
MVDSLGGDMDQGSTLLRLQDLELEIRRAEKKLDEMPEKRAILETRAKRREVEALGAKAQELVDRLQREIQKNEDESASLSEKIDAEQARVMSGDITNAKEIQHLTREIDALKRRREKLEMEELQFIERVEKAKGQAEKVKTALDQLERKEAKLTEEFTARGGELQTSVQRLGEERDQARSDLDPDVSTRYEELKATKGGIGAGLLRDSACTACRVELPAEQVERLLSGPEIGTCPNCHRMIVVLDQEGGESS